MKQNPKLVIESYKKIFENSPIGMSLCDSSGQCIAANNAIGEIVGASREQVESQNFNNIESWKRSGLLEAANEALRTDKIIWREITLTSTFGKNVSGNVHIVPFSVADENYLLFTFHDTAEQKRLEHELLRSNKKYEILFESVNDGIFMIEKKGNIVDVNHTAYERLGYTKEEMLCMHITDLDTPEFAAKVPERIKQIRTNGSAFFEAAHLKKDGSAMPVEVNARLIKLEGEEILISVIRDITERKKLEEEYLKVQKLESTGVLAGGIAHDFNNILTATFGNLSMAKMYAGSNEKITKALNEIDNASCRAKDLAQQLLTFSKGGDPIKILTKLNKLIKESASLALTGSNVNCDMVIMDELLPAYVDLGQISRVIQNIVKNADQAMPDGGTIVIEAGNKDIREEELLPLREGKYVWIKIKDQGIGIPEKHLAKIFDPYFTTKQKGSGLGLATSYSIISKHDGFIKAESEPGEGTIFHVYIPASTEKVPTRKRTVEEKLLHSGEKILVMDDDRGILEIASQMLEVMGFKAETATTGQDAIELYRNALQEGSPFGAVILDLTIPGGMGGKATLKQLVEIYPAVKAIVSSGYANDPIMSDYKRHGFKGIVAKPYDLENLGEALRKVFD